MAAGASDIGHLMQQGFNFVQGSAWVMTAGSFMYSADCQHYMSSHLDDENSVAGSMANYKRTSPLQGLYRTC
jgi:hypothetical protein